MSKSTNVKVIKLADSKKGVITISHIEAPYGENSHPVVSIGISLKGDIENPDWKAHIPYENLDELISSLKSLKESSEN